jgi:hypothetical protein
MALTGPVSAYVREFTSALHTEESEAVAALLSFAAILPSTHEFSIRHAGHAPRHRSYTTDSSRTALLNSVQGLSSHQRAVLADAIEGQCGDREWSSIIAAHLQAVGALFTAGRNEDFDMAFSFALTSLKDFASLFEHQETNWLVTALHVLSHDAVYLLHTIEKRLAKEWMQDRVGKQLVRRLDVLLYHYSDALV